MEALKSKYRQLFGDKFFLEPNVNSVETYLKNQGWLKHEDQLREIEVPGEGNMNLVLRATPSQAPSLILKQARPWVEKYPQIAAPVERIEVEHTFYQQARLDPRLSIYSPTILGFDKPNSLLTLQDLGQATDFAYVYGSEHIFNQSELEAALTYLNTIKLLSVPARYPSNLALRKLNHQHIFHLPFIADNQFNLDDIQPGLQALSQSCRHDKELYRRIESLGQCYLADGDTLLHGDFYPGSLLQAKTGLKVIDPEFSFIGPVEWDIAIFIAHLFLSSAPKELILSGLKLYQKPPQFDPKRFSGFVGTEILRRLIGLAQLPLEMDLEQKAQLIKQSIQWIKKGNIDILPS